MDEELPSFTHEERVTVDIAKSLFERINILTDLVRVSDLSDEVKERYLKSLETSNVVDQAVDGFLGAVIANLDLLFHADQMLSALFIFNLAVFIGI
jgi:hypothetical protein